MTEQLKIACSISSTDPEAQIGLEIWIDGNQIYDSEHVADPIAFAHEVDCADGDHLLRFVMKNKTSAHTTIDSTGAITKDSCICIENLSFDEIKLGQIFIENAVYQHNFNGNGDTIKDGFYGRMGCNGTVSLSFVTPIYIWLLENM
jgi:hypothetical protein